MKFQILSIIFGVFIAFRCNAQVDISLDSAHLDAGNATTLHLAVTGNDAPTETNFSSWDSLVPPENRLSHTEWRQDGSGHWAQDMTFIAFDSAQLQLPPVLIQLKSGKVVSSPPIALRVMVPPVEINDILDIKDIHRETGFYLSDYLFWIIALVILLLGLIFRKKILEKIKAWLKIGKNTINSQKVEMPAHLLALKKLSALEAKNSWQAGDTKGFCAELSYIIREYLEKKYSIPALESTTDEIIKVLTQKNLFSDSKTKELQKILQWTDLAKFAKGTPPSDFPQDSIAKCRSLVQLGS